MSQEDLKKLREEFLDKLEGEIYFIVTNLNLVVPEPDELHGLIDKAWVT